MNMNLYALTGKDDGRNSFKAGWPVKVITGEGEVEAVETIDSVTLSKPATAYTKNYTFNATTGRTVDGKHVKPISWTEFSSVLATLRGRGSCPECEPNIDTDAEVNVARQWYSEELSSREKAFVRRLIMHGL